MAGTPPAQRDIMDVLHRLLHGKPDSMPVADSTAKRAVSLLPALSLNPATGLLVGVAVSVLAPPIVAGGAPSTANGSVSFSTKGQFKAVLRGDVFTHGGSAVRADWRYLNTNQPTYGLGPIQPTDRKTDMDFKLLRLSQSISRSVLNRLYVGGGYDLNFYFDIADRGVPPGVTSPFVAYSGDSVTQTLSSGLSARLLYDSRDSPVYATRGQYATASFAIFPQWLGSDDDWQSLMIEGRFYTQVTQPGHGILAMWGLGWFTFGPAPYLDLPAIGWDLAGRSGRGYVQGRIRAEDLLYAEGEYRVTLSRDGFWGAAAFLNLTFASDPVTRAFQPPSPGGGFGLRVKLNKRSITNITIDFAVGAQGSTGVFVGSGEAF